MKNNFTIKTPLIKYKSNISIKPENLQVLGSYKIRGIEYFFNNVDKKILKNGIVAISAGNMGQTIALLGKKYGVKVKIIVPNNTPNNKVSKIKSLGASIIKKPMKELWTAMLTGHIENEDGYFIHTHNKHLLKGYASIAKEILDENPLVTDIVIPFGTGGLTRGIAEYCNKTKTNIKIHTVEPTSLSPAHDYFTNKLETTKFDKLSIIDALGAPSLLPYIINNFSDIIDVAHVVNDEDVISSLSELLFDFKLLTEPSGAAGIPIANSINGSNIVVILTGGNIERKLLFELIEKH